MGGWVGGWVYLEEVSPEFGDFFTVVGGGGGVFDGVEEDLVDVLVEGGGALCRVGGWVGDRKVEEIEAVGMRYCTSWVLSLPSSAFIE